MSRTVRGIAADQRILGALEAGPLTANEIAYKLRREVWEAWAARHGYEDVEWETDREPLGARLLAFSEADGDGSGRRRACHGNVRPDKGRITHDGLWPGRRPMSERRSSMEPLTAEVARRVAETLRADGFERCTAGKVLAVARGESLPDEESLVSAIMQEADIS